MYGDPLLVGLGTMEGATQVTLTLTNALEDAAGVLVVGFAAIDLPLLGGTLVPDPNPPGFIQPLPTDATGAAQLTGLWPVGVPPGFSTYFQAWLIDPAG